jgi:phosphoglycolate phosphatase
VGVHAEHGPLVVTRRKSTLIVDLDNTLFDWVGLWFATFSAMMNKVSEQTGIALEFMEPEIRAIHQLRRTSEYAFLLSDITALEAYRAGRPATEAFVDAIRAFRETRRAKLALYPKVAETLLAIKGAGTQIIAYTESLRYYSFYRLKRLGLDGVIDFLYSPADHDVPSELDRFYREDFYGFQYTQHRFTPPGELKPNPTLLLAIVGECRADTESVAYVGDSLHKDIAMAQSAGIDCAWAKYGEAQDSEAYSLLKRVTHWTDEDVKREAEIRAKPVTAELILKSGFDEILDLFHFSDRHRRTGGQAAL